MSDTWLIETDELARLIADEPSADRVVLDCSWHLPDAGKHALDDFRAGHIPGARFVDLAEISDPDSAYANMMPPAEQFARVTGDLGIGAGTEVVVYDAGYVSARLWWMFRSFGHDRVRILNGGWRRWKAEDREVETGDPAPATSQAFPATPVGSGVVDLSEMRALVEAGETVIVDARTAAKFDGRESSGYPGVPSGHMPGAINTPWQLFFEPAPSYRFVPASTAREIFISHGVDLSNPIVTTCGSGVTAAILGFMLARLGVPEWRLYDGSWHEWGQQPDTVKLER